MRRWYQVSPTLQQCEHCPNGDFCLRHGCVAWNDEARTKYDRWKAAADKFDAAEADYIEPSGCRRGDLPGGRR